MKIIVLLLSILIISQPTNAVRTCESYIPDEWPDYRYTVAEISGDNVVTDNKTGLMWKQCSEGLTGADCGTGSLMSYTWKQALDLPITEDFAGFSDWRVPNIEELRSIVAINCFNPAINEMAFPNTPSDWFWSASPFTENPGLAWNITFNSGYDFNYGRLNNFHVRLVRTSGQ